MCSADAFLPLGDQQGPEIIDPAALSLYLPADLPCTGPDGQRLGWARVTQDEHGVRVKISPDVAGFPDE